MLESVLMLVICDIRIKPIVLFVLVVEGCVHPGAVGADLCLRRGDTAQFLRSACLTIVKFALVDED